MNDNKLKIRIQIQQQPPKAIEQIYPDLAEPEIIYEQTYDWGKIAIVVIGLLCAVVLISYLIFSSSDEPTATSVLPAEQQLTPSQNNLGTPQIDQPGAALGNNASIAEFNQSQPKHTEAQSTAKTPPSDNDAVAAPSMNVPAVKPKSALSSNKPMITPRKKPQSPGKVMSRNTSDRPEILRAQLTHAIKGREPVDIVESIALQPGESKPIFFYVHLRNLQDQEVIIQWYLDDQLDSQLPLKIRANTWRAHARKQLDHERLGAWRVEVVDNSGKVLAARHFDVSQH